MIKVENLSYTYSPGTVYEKRVLKNINFEINDGEFVAIIGHTGSGKSTLIQHLNGLIKGDEGKIYYNGEDIYDDKYDLTSLRLKVGLAFQYSDYQFFEEDVLTDVSFGPKNKGLSKEEAIKVSKEALSDVGMGEEYYKKSPFMLSGGQKKRVAIAGILAMEPEVLILDEPTAGLDPKGRDKILDKIYELHKKRNITVVLVSHSMEDVAKYADRIIVMNDGEIVYNDIPANVFADAKKLEKIGLSVPQVTYILNDLKEAGIPVRTDIYDPYRAAEHIAEVLEQLKRD